MDELSELFKALGDKNRLRIINLLKQRSLCVCEITEILKLAPSTVSRHLSILKNIGIIKDKKDRKWVNYSLNVCYDNVLITVLMPLILSQLKTDSQAENDWEKLEKMDRNFVCKSKDSLAAISNNIEMGAEINL
ncbi:MAG: winged helix-turn-helix transcriptional regulator [Calditrichaeota bacterium]|nr:winged helix-turn-helix transcriptional regulator [Calditrichota bacterium]